MSAVDMRHLMFFFRALQLFADPKPVLDCDWFPAKLDFTWSYSGACVLSSAAVFSISVEVQSAHNFSSYYIMIHCAKFYFYKAT